MTAHQALTPPKTHKNLGRMTTAIAKVFYDYDHSPAAFAASPSVLLRAARQIDPKVTRTQVDKFLANSYTNVRHRRKRPTRKTVQNRFTNSNIRWDCDLMFTDPNRRPILVCADNFTSKIFAQAMTRKTAKTTADAFLKMVKQQNDNIMPAAVRTDRGCCSFNYLDKYLL